MHFIFGTKKKFIRNFPFGLVQVNYKIEEGKVIYKKVHFYNPEKIHELYKGIVTVDYQTFLKKIEVLKNKPKLILFFIKDFDQVEKIFLELPKERNFSTTIQLYTHPRIAIDIFVSNKDEISNTFSVYVNAFLLESLQKENHYISIFLFQDITKENYLYRLMDQAVPIGIFLYRDTFVDVNEQLCKITEYSKEELYNMPIWKLADESIRDMVQDIATKRIEGIRGDRHYNEVCIYTKSGNKKWLQVFGTTVNYKGVFYGLGVVLDITERKIQEIKNQELKNFYKTISEVQRVLITSSSNSEIEILAEVAEILISHLNLNLVIIHKEDSESRKPFRLLKKIKENYESKNIDEIDTILSHIIYEKVFIENQIHYFDTQKNQNHEYFQKLSSLRILSFSSIPIQTPKDKYVLTLCSFLYGYFSEEIKDLLSKVKTTIEFSFQKLYQTKWLRIYQQILENANVTFILTNSQNKILYANPYLENLSEYAFDELLYKDPKIFSSYLHPKEFFQKLWNRILQKRIFSDIFINRKKSGELFCLHQSIFPILENDEITHYAAIGIDITEKFLQQEIAEVMLYDPITNLPNRFFFSEHLEIFLKFQRIGKGNSDLKFAIIELDIFNFSSLNQTEGPNFGDIYLKFFAELLRSFMENQDFHYLLGKYDDEFFIFVDLSKINDIEKSLLSFLHKLIQTCQNEYTIYDTFRKINTQQRFPFHAGITIFPNDYPEIKKYSTEKEIVQILLQNLNIALNEAKKESPYTYKFYNAFL
ncbi:MAG: sensor domain-containing diguanylate cyclase [Leptospiraceae bacterium]|nr:sensor domain-containing diguanylate cyclase [Leptospiraceae bacterium]MDW7975555.1 PAS domain S-box protein [Leptospiraceae bacterium]